MQILTYPVVEEGDHPIGIHGFAGVGLEILEIADNLFGEDGSLRLEGRDPVRVRLLEFGLDGLHVPLEISQIGLLIESGGLEPEGVDDIVDLSGTVFEGLLLVLSGGVGTCPGSVVNPGMRFSRIHSTDINIGARLDGDQGTVDFVGDIVDEFSKFPFVN